MMPDFTNYADFESWISQHQPRRGPCAFCDHPDARHREWNAWVDRHKAGDSLEKIAQDFDVSIEVVEAVVRQF